MDRDRWKENPDGGGNSELHFDISALILLK